MERLLTRPLARRASLLLAALAAALAVTAVPAEAAPPDHAQAHNAARSLDAPGHGVEANGWTWIRTADEDDEFSTQGWTWIR